MTDIVISQTPLRISFLGGGTDFPEWYSKNGGAVLSTTINKYCHIVCVPSYPFYDYQYRIVYSNIEVANNVDGIKHPVVREALRSYPNTKNIEIHYSGDLPAGAGLGASSAFSVGIINVLEKYNGRDISKKKLARSAIHLEREVLKEVVGCQDQVATSFGGINHIEFHKNGEFDVKPLKISSDRSQLLQDHLMLFFSGIKRRSSTVASSVVQKMADENSGLKDIKALVSEGVNVLTNESTNISEFGRLLNLNWQLKKQLSQAVSNKVVDDMYEKALQSGAIGGKLLGAGGGGFLLLFVEPEKQAQVAHALRAFKRVEFEFEDEGSRAYIQDTQHEDDPSYWNKKTTASKSKNEIH